MALQDNRRRATQPGEFTIVGDSQLRRIPSQHGGFQFGLNYGAEASPRRGNVACKQNHLRSERGGNQPQASSEPGSLTSQRSQRSRISFFGQTEQFMDVD